MQREYAKVVANQLVRKRREKKSFSLFLCLCLSRTARAFSPIAFFVSDFLISTSPPRFPRTRARTNERTNGRTRASESERKREREIDEQRRLFSTFFLMVAGFRFFPSSLSSLLVWRLPSFPPRSLNCFWFSFFTFSHANFRETKKETYFFCFHRRNQ